MNKPSIIALKCDIQNALSEWILDRQKQLDTEINYIPEPQCPFGGYVKRSDMKKYYQKISDAEVNFNNTTYEMLVDIKEYLKTLGINVDEYKKENRI